ncbi:MULTISPECIES: HK97-gp10 family putative phage morphogenesis protein [Mammaliicoccus]|uniref:HK97-gp10 family putative phage morphogenesis protein n=1 Tax=Mammaliicoccus TaxID=2803850 RepID=UPI00065B8916|nr:MULTISPECIES: HK97-gp10 family putative phage morphogenesis protein [Mammaliicoccus]AQN32267.1 putative tail-component [Staphylococcus phage phi879]MCD5140444.1 hypothetical protein [Mammaliicoccus sciuri]PNY96182.1 hypothetical protein CD035_04215 [Mammaliicoccus sciuri]SQE50890.1 gp10 family phage protein [Mammaliicoccus sciuri]
MGGKIVKNTVAEGLKRELLQMSTLEKRVLKAGASTIIPILRKNTPLGEQQRHARNYIAISNVKTDRSTLEKYVAVGYEKGYSHRIHTTEFGTMYQRPQLFITKSEKESRNIVFNAMKTAMKRGLR